MPSTPAERLFAALDRHDHESMASCYSDTATFSDIAFDLQGKTQIHAMWHMICAGDIRCTFEVLEDSTRGAIVNVVDDYTFSATKKRVHNVIRSRLTYVDGMIVEHVDDCDPRKWASMAFGHLLGFIPGRYRFPRHVLAHLKLLLFKAKHHEYRETKESS